MCTKFVDTSGLKLPKAYATTMPKGFMGNGYSSLSD